MDKITDKITYEDGIRIIVEYDGEKLIFELPSDSDIYDWENKFRAILNFITYDNEIIDRILISEEKALEKDNS